MSGNSAFISYSGRDQSIVENFVRILKAHGVGIYFAPTDMREGNFITQLNNGLRDSKMMVAFISPASIESYWANLEWGAQLCQIAKDNTRGLLPVLLPGLPDEQIPALLRTLETLDFRQLNPGLLQNVQELGTRLVQKIRDRFPPAGVESLGVPFIVASMTKQQAQELESGEALKTASDEAQERFARFRELLKQLGLERFSEQYGEVSESWSPAIFPEAHSSPPTIRELILEALEQFNTGNDRASLPYLYPQFYSSDFFSTDQQLFRQARSYLAGVGCVLVVDAISMFHPHVWQRVTATGLGSLDRVCVVSISPASSAAMMLHNTLQRATEELMPLGFDRFASGLDIKCELNVGHVLSFKRWLKVVLPQAEDILRSAVANPARKRAVRNEQGTPSGVGSIFLGGPTKGSQR